jgi:DnaK suppressor protein
MMEFERKMKKKLEEMRAYVRSKLRYTPNIPQEERADIIDFTSAEKIRDIESIITSIDTDVLKLIERALDKINSGTYGYCENCGVRIDKERLEEVPYVRYCIDCQERIELGEMVSKVGEEEISPPPIKVALEDTSIEIEPEEPEEETRKVEKEEEEEEEETSLEEEIADEEIGEERMKEAENLDKEIEEEIEEELEEELREEQYIEEPPEEEEKEELKGKKKKETRKMKIAGKRKKSKLAKPKPKKRKRRRRKRRKRLKNQKRNRRERKL